MLVSTQTKAVLLVAMLCGARAARFEDELNVTQQLLGVALEEDLAKADNSISHLSGTCDKGSLSKYMLGAVSQLQKGQNLNWFNLAQLMTDLSIITALIRGGCTGQDLQPGQWDMLQAAMQTLRPQGLPHGEIVLNGGVADTFSLAVFGKLWQDQFPNTAMPAVTSDPSDTMDEATAAVASTKSEMDRFMSDISPHQVDPFNRPLSLVETGSNASQLVSGPKGNWNPVFFVGGIVVGLVALVVTLICAMLNVTTAILFGVLNGVFGSIYCLIKKGIQMRNPNAETFLTCMTTNAIAEAFKVVWRCNMACGVWGLVVSRESFKLAFDIKQKGQDKDVIPVCLKK